MWGLLAGFLACWRECEVVHGCVIVFQVGVCGLGNVRECSGENFLSNCGGFLENTGEFLDSVDYVITYVRDLGIGYHMVPS